MKITLYQTELLLAKIARGDGRTVTEAMASQWYRALADVDYVKAMQAASLLERSPEPITPGMIRQQVTALFAEDAAYQPAGNGHERHAADKPANFDALSAVWDDPVRFAQARRAYQDQLDEVGYLGPEIS